MDNSSLPLGEEEEEDGSQVVSFIIIKNTHKDEGQERVSDHTQGCKYLFITILIITTILIIETLPPARSEPPALGLTV